MFLLEITRAIFGMYRELIINLSLAAKGSYRGDLNVGYLRDTIHSIIADSNDLPPQLLESHDVNKIISNMVISSDIEADLVFALFDPDNDGFMTHVDFIHLISFIFGPNLRSQQINHLWKSVLSPGGKPVSRAQYLAWLNTGLSRPDFGPRRPHTPFCKSATQWVRASIRAAKKPTLLGAYLAIKQGFVPPGFRPSWNS